MGMLAIRVEEVAPSRYAYKPAHRRGRILLAEDDEDTRALLATMLRLEGWEVAEAVDGAELLSQIELAARMGGFSAIIADNQMPYLLGMDVLAALSCANLELPFILITAHADRALREEAAGLGVSALLSKPFTHESLRHALRVATEA